MFKTDDDEVETLSIKVESRKLAYEIVHDECSVSFFTFSDILLIYLTFVCDILLVNISNKILYSIFSLIPQKTTKANKK